jgi:hypothetical protein
MNIKPEISAEITELIKDFVNHPQDSIHTKELQESVAKFHALPLAFNLDYYAIKPNGEIIVLEPDSPHKFRTETNPRIINSILFQGIKKYRELEELMPVRCESDPICSSCDGTGINPLAEQLNLEDGIICYCGGLGWIPKT